jgi:hypothetical protein
MFAFFFRSFVLVESDTGLATGVQPQAETILPDNLDVGVLFKKVNARSSALKRAS